MSEPRRGDRYEFHSVPIGEVWEYEVESVEEDQAGLAGRTRLRNIANDGIASVLNKSLRRESGWPGRSFWRKVEA